MIVSKTALRRNQLNLRSAELESWTWLVQAPIAVQTDEARRNSVSSRLRDYDYELPREFIAQHPAEPRDRSRLFVLDRATGEIEHRRFNEIVDYLDPDDLLVLNDTRVIPARLVGRRDTGGRVEILLIEKLDESGRWLALVKTRGKPRAGEPIRFDASGMCLELCASRGEGKWEVAARSSTELEEIVETTGRAPLPPYIRREAQADPHREHDLSRYQTVFASAPGAIAAPTAGLHFTEELIERITLSGTQVVNVTLHVGLGTFRPVRADDVAQHDMHRERFEVSPEAAAQIRSALESGRRIVCVGTTTCRVLETLAQTGGVRGGQGDTSLFIYPPYSFSAVGALLTNFHLPKSTLLMLVSAFAGRERILHAYEIAKREGYRFYSYGDAMLIL